MLSGCYYDKEEDLYPARYCDLTDATYTNRIQPLVQANCAISGCHVADGDGPGDFTQFDELKAYADNGELRTRVLDDQDMPPSGPLSSCDREIIRLWLEAGALND
jgi:hypothetical protein